MLVLVLAGAGSAEAAAQSLQPYIESSGNAERPRSNLGVAVDADRLRLRADVALRGSGIPADGAQSTPGGGTEVVPNLRSTIAVAKSLDLETRVSFAEWNAGSEATVDTRLRYRKSLDWFVEQLEGNLWRTPDGATKQTLRLGFRGLDGDSDVFTPWRVTSAAVFEATQSDSALAQTSADTHKLGVETRVTGLMPRFAKADQSLSLKVEKLLGGRSESASTLAYDQLWAVSPSTNLGVSVKLLSSTAIPAFHSQPSIDFTWRGRL